MGIDIFDRGLEIFGDIFSTVQTFLDDIAVKFGTGGTVQVLYETADANANAVIFVAPEGDGTDVPAFIFGDVSILNADLGWFNGLTEPSIVVVNDAKDAYIRIDSGDDAVAGSKGIYFKTAADEDIEIINLSLTGTPRILWDESDDLFAATKGLRVGSLIGSNANNQIFEAVVAGDSQYGGGAFTTWSSTIGGTFLDIKTGNHATAGNYTAIDTARSVGWVRFLATDGTDFQPLAYILAKTMGTIGNNRVPGQLEFHVYTDAATSVDTTVMTLTATSDTMVVPVTFSASVDSAAVADQVSVGAYEIGADQRALAWSQEYAAIASIATASTHKIPVRFNGATIYLLASNV